MLFPREGMDSEIVDISDTNYQEIIEQYPLIFVDCWAIWCQPCLALDPLFDKLAEEYSERIKIAKLNVAENPHLHREYELTGLPSFLVFKDGEFLAKYPWMFFSLNPEVTIRKAIDDLIE